MQYVWKKEVVHVIAMEDAARSALRWEEAALLPALPRQRNAGGKAALQQRLCAAARMKEMRLSGEFHDLVSAVEQADDAARRPCRAALHHVTGR